MIVYFVLVCGLGLIFAVSGGQELTADIEVPKLRMPFYRAGYYLAKRFRMGKNEKWTERNETEKLASALMVLFLGLGISLLAEGAMFGSRILTENNEIVRPAKGEGDKSYELQAKVEGIEETENMKVLVAERRYTYEEKQEYLAQAMEQLDTVVLGENTSPDEVRGQVVLPAELMEGKVSVQWIQEPDGYLDSEGNVSEDLPQEGTLLQLKALLSCEDQEADHELALRLYPPVRDEREQVMFALRKQVETANENTVEETAMILPSEVEGKEIDWREPQYSVLANCLLISILAALCAYLGKEQEFRQEKARRQRQLIMDYPNLLFKMSMLLDAGLTMQNVFSKIAFEYRDREDKQVRYAYEEMLAACYEMKSGISEGQAYENFGRRCGETCYIRLGTTLAGNLQKGSQGLTRLLWDEAATAMDERRQLARKLGEEAGTKLLLPMVLMLMIVLVILMIPAVMAF